MHMHQYKAGRVYNKIELGDSFELVPVFWAPSSNLSREY